jgi:ABC-type Fe3+ transport system substrate-binding protein
MVQDYLEYVLSPQAQKMVFEEGFLPIKPLSKPQGGSDSGQSGSDD